MEGLVLHYVFAPLSAVRLQGLPTTATRRNTAACAGEWDNGLLSEYRCQQDTSAMRRAACTSRGKCGTHCHANNSR